MRRIPFLKSKLAVWITIALIIGIGLSVNYVLSDKIANKQQPLQPSISTSPSPTITEEDVVYCTQDAKLCPDGSYVGRQGPNCEFAPCPGE